MENEEKNLVLKCILLAEGNQGNGNIITHDAIKDIFIREKKNIIGEPSVLKELDGSLYTGKISAVNLIRQYDAEGCSRLFIEVDFELDAESSERYREAFS